MTKTHIAPESDRLIVGHSVSAEQTDPTPRTRQLSPFWRHFFQMLAAMAVGMIATGAIFLSAAGAKTWDEVTTDYPNQALLAMAAGMSIPMVAWMTYRGMGWRHSLEMAAAMVLPVVPFLCLVWFKVTASAQCGPYCIATIATMLALMFHRRERYAWPPSRSEA
jgi:cytochrome bd-type quinol oxidase subunit 2